MEAAAVSIEDSYRRCEQLARRSASSFYWAFWFLDREQRRSMYALYAFSRQTDDVVDGAATFTNGSAIHPATSTTASTASTSSLTSTASLASRPSLTTTATAADRVAYPVAGQVAGQAVGRLADSASLDRWRDAWHAALAGDYRDPLLPAVVDTVRRRRIPPRYLDALIAGVARDLRPEPFATRVELTDYCEKVASAVGICCLHIWLNQPEPAYEAARECGLAFQLTNILRDLREDAERGRLYLPLEELAEHQLAPGPVLAMLRGAPNHQHANHQHANNEHTHQQNANNEHPNHQHTHHQHANNKHADNEHANHEHDVRPRDDEALVALIQRQIAIAAKHYEAGWETRRFLSAGPGRAFALMFNTYRELLARIARHPRRVLVQAPRIGPARKLWLAARACWGSPPHADFQPAVPPHASPIPPVARP